MKVDQHQIPRESLIWIIVAQLVCVSPHISHVPFWVFIFSFLCVYWRWLIYQGRLSHPKPRVRSFIAVICLVSIAVYYKKLYSLEPAIVLLVITYFLKLIELYRTKDAYVILFLSYFLIATEFIYSNKIWAVLYLAISFSVVTGALIALNRSHRRHHSLDTLKASVKLAFLSIPFAIVFFIFFPRMPPLWVMDMSPNSGVIGLGEEISPGDISDLGKSSKLAFRAEFFGPIPSRDRLYWRTMVYSNFDGRSWSKASTLTTQSKFWRLLMKTPEQLSRIESLGPDVSYRISLEPTNFRELVTLQMPINFEKDAAMLTDFSLIVDKPIKSFRSYNVTSTLDYRVEQSIRPWVYHRELQLPNNYNPITRSYALRLYETLKKDPETMIQYVLNKFNTENYVYTLKPPLMGRDSIDDFMFKHQRGFCGHYASAFVFMMRSVGIPARVVGGYHGGEVSPFGNYVLVHQFDAHAWAEVWLDGKGWVSIDPTAYVAPDRIAFGLEDALEEDEFLENSLFSAVKYSGNKYLNNLRFSWDYINHSWNKAVVNYDKQRQLEFLSRNFGLSSSLSMLLSALGIILLAFLILAVYLLLVSKPKGSNEIDLLYTRWCRGLASEALIRKVGEGPTSYLARIKKDSHLDDTLIESAEKITELYQVIQYNKEGLEKANYYDNKQKLAKLIKLFLRKLSARKRRKFMTKRIF